MLYRAKGYPGGLSKLIKDDAAFVSSVAARMATEQMQGFSEGYAQGAVQRNVDLLKYIAKNIDKPKGKGADEMSKDFLANAQPAAAEKASVGEGMRFVPSGKPPGAPIKALSESMPSQFKNPFSSSSSSPSAPLIPSSSSSSSSELLIPSSSSSSSPSSASAAAAAASKPKAAVGAPGPDTRSRKSKRPREEVAAAAVGPGDRDGAAAAASSEELNEEGKRAKEKEGGRKSRKPRQSRQSRRRTTRRRKAPKYLKAPKFIY
jgi:hypothetical protein